MRATSATIFARASGEGKSGVAVFRISGPDAQAVVPVILGGSPLVPRRAARRTVFDPGSGTPIDDAIVLFFPAPGSFTGEDVIEIQVHGSRAVERSLLTVLAGMPGLRIAEPGEFARRAFENGRLDLAQVEGLADLIEAETEAQRRLALRTMRGEASETMLVWRDRLLRCLALVEAAVDFPEEDDDTGGYGNTVGREIVQLSEAIRGELAGGGAAEQLRNGIEVAVVGPPNVGKSLLVNRLAKRDISISTSVPGTTRDIIEARLDIGGLPVTVLDTAGLREPRDEVEEEGVRRATCRAGHADLRLHVTAPDVTAPSARFGPLWREDDIEVANKCDLGVEGPDRGDISRVSAHTGEGISDLVERIGARFARVEAMASPAAAAARRRGVLEACVEELKRGSAGLDAAAPPEVIAEHLRCALRELGRFAGHVDVEDVLDIIFAEFCLGK